MRNLDPTFKAGLNAPVIEPVLFSLLTFRSQTCYLCSAGFNIGWNGQVWTGLGTFGGISSVVEGTEVKADGISLTLSGIDNNILAECEADILPLAPASCWLGLMLQGGMVGVPYRFFNGVVDAPVISTTPTEATITLKLESRIALLNRPSQRRYTTADQHANGFPDDIGFSWVEKLSDMALRFGS